MSPPLPPGPSESSVAQAVRFGADPFGYLTRLQRRFGDTFTLRLPRDPVRVVCSHPDDIKTIFSLKPDDYRASEQGIPLALGERSLLLMDGDAHSADRRLILPTLLGEDLDGHAAHMRIVTKAAITSWPTNTPFAGLEAIRDITLEVICRCVFGIHDGRVEEIKKLVTAWLDRALSSQVFLAGIALSSLRVRTFLDRATKTSPVWQNRPTRHRVFPWQRIADAKAALMQILHREVRRLRDGESAPRADVLSRLAVARFDDGTVMSDAHLVDELVTLLVGGHETTANALSWALSEILPRKDIVLRLRAEIDAVFPSGEIDPRRVQELHFLDACVQESMRLMPIALAAPRALTRDLVLREAVAPAGAFVWACVYLTHRSLALWRDPDVFRPDRFLERKPTQSEFYPFGGGRRRCTGMSFANLEIRVVLAELFSRVTLELAKGASKPMIRGVTMSPADGLPLVLRSRRG